MTSESSLADWLDELAEPVGSPGGGAACGVMIAMSAALLRMVAGYTSDDARASAAAERLTVHRHSALAATDADGAQSALLGAALGLPANDPHRDLQIRRAATDAARSSVALAEVGQSIFDELKLLVEVGNPALIADLVVAGEALGAGLAGACTNLRSNISLITAHVATGSGTEHDESPELTSRLMHFEGVRTALFVTVHRQNLRASAS